MARVAQKIATALDAAAVYAVAATVSDDDNGDDEDSDKRGEGKGRRKSCCECGSDTFTQS